MSDFNAIDLICVGMSNTDVLETDDLVHNYWNRDIIGVDTPEQLYNYDESGLAAEAIDKYRAMLRNGNVPPLVISRGEVVDGYHRLSAAWFEDIHAMEVIYDDNWVSKQCQ